MRAKKTIHTSPPTYDPAPILSSSSSSSTVGVTVVGRVVVVGTGVRS